MLRYFRYAVLGIFVVSAALTPPDMVSIFLLAIPLLLLYVLSVGVSYMFRAQAPLNEPAAEPPAAL
jgi:sec-independent protein translocase protein TatC